MTEQKPKARIHVTDDLVEGITISPDSDQIHYLGRVMRLAAGDPVSLFNGRHGEWRGIIDNISKKSAAITLSRQTRQQREEPDLWLAFAPLKKSRTDFLVEKSTELGAARLFPVFTDHTDAGRVNTSRLQQVATEAAEQCERLSVPKVMEARRLSEFLDSWPIERTLLVADETGGGRPIKEVLDRPAERNASYGFLAGPEGGFSPVELDALAKLPFSVFISLGPRILRAETAALAMLATIQSLVGDWHLPPRSV